MTHVDTIDQSDPFPVGTEGRYNVHIRLGFQWDHEPSDDEIRKFNDTAVEATNSLLKSSTWTIDKPSPVENAPEWHWMRRRNESPEPILFWRHANQHVFADWPGGEGASDITSAGFDGVMFAGPISPPAY